VGVNTKQSRRFGERFAGSTASGQIPIASLAVVQTQITLYRLVEDGLRLVQQSDQFPAVVLRQYMRLCHPLMVSQTRRKPEIEVVR
jgi:hypothetical protein